MTKWSLVYVLSFWLEKLYNQHRIDQPEDIFFKFFDFTEKLFVVEGFLDF